MIDADKLQIGKYYRFVGYMDPVEKPESTIGTVVSPIRSSGGHFLCKILYTPVHRNLDWITISNDLYEELSDEESLIYKLAK
jgi:hypothetical protein